MRSDPTRFEWSVIRRRQGQKATRCCTGRLRGGLTTKSHALASIYSLPILLKITGDQAGILRYVRPILRKIFEASTT